MCLDGSHLLWRSDATSIDIDFDSSHDVDTTSFRANYREDGRYIDYERGYIDCNNVCRNCVYQLEKTLKGGSLSRKALMGQSS